MRSLKAKLAALTLLAGGLAGCKQQAFFGEADLEQYRQNGLPEMLAKDPTISQIPATSNTAAPTTVDDPDRKLRYMSLQEAIAIGLEQGNVGSQSVLFPGIANDALAQFNGRTVGGSDNIRVLALEPAIAFSDIEAALSKFDARWITSTQWIKQDEGISNILQNFQNGDQATVSTGVYKPLPTGGLAGITYSTSYQFYSQPPAGVLNPTYRPRLQFVFEQSLLQNFGVEINQLNTALPQSSTISGLRPSGGQRTEGILITRIRYDQQRAEFERNINFLLLNVEYAYWNLYGSYFTLFSREQGLRQAFESVKLNKARLDAGRIAPQDYEQTLAQYELFRAQRITALGQVLDNERQLRGLLNLPVEDGTRIVPSDSPTVAAFNPDWNSARDEAVSLRPELILARHDLKFRQLDIITQKNLLKPDLRFTATYDINGIGTRLDGSAGVVSTTGTASPSSNAMASFTDNRFNNWQLGLRMDVPIGNRDAYAAVRNARLNLGRSYWQLKDQEQKAERFLALQYRRLFQYYAEIQAQRAQRQANARQLEARFKEYTVGRGTLDVLLEAQRNFADSLSSEFAAITNYNNALCGFQYAKGTLMQYDNVLIGDGPLPTCVQVRATEHAREKSRALVLRTRPDLGSELINVGGSAMESGSAAPSYPPMPSMAPLATPPIPELTPGTYPANPLPNGTPTPMPTIPTMPKALAP